MLAPSCFILLHMSMFLVTPTWKCQPYQFQYFLGRLCIELDCWNKYIWQVIPMALVNCIYKYKKRKGITNAFENCPCMCVVNSINQCLWMIAITHHDYRLRSRHFPNMTTLDENISLVCQFLFQQIGISISIHTLFSPLLVTHNGKNFTWNCRFHNFQMLALQKQGMLTYLISSTM